MLHLAYIWTVDGEGHEDVPVELSTLVVTGVNKADPPTGYKSAGDEIVYNEVWDRTAEVEESEVEESKVIEGEVGDSEVERGDHFE